MSWLCRLGTEMTAEVHGTLGRAVRSHGRRQLSEEHVTYRLLDLLDDAGADGAPVWIRDFGRTAEAANGADLELWFWDRVTNLATGWLIQAKRLYPPTSGGSSPTFDQLEHSVGGRPQADLLIEATKHTPGLSPVYWLYGWDFEIRTSCSGRQGCKCTPYGLDNTLLVASASWIQSRPGKTWHRVVSAGGPKVESLRRLLCNNAGSVRGLAERVNALANSRSGSRPVADGLPWYVGELVDPQFAVDQEADGRPSAGSTAQRLALIEITN